MHHWGDDGVDWGAISGAARDIGDFCTKWGRLPGQSKEKYGTVRFYASFGHLSLHGLIYPQYCHNRFPKWLWYLDCEYLSKGLRFLFSKPFYHWQTFIYRKAYKRALAKYPHIREEILCCADWPGLLEGL